MNVLNVLRRRLKSSDAMDDWLRTGMTIEFLGTSSARPTKTRNVSSLLLHHEKTTLMFDCGDGTHRQLLNSPIGRPTRVGAIFITHLHSDHYYGLPAVGLCLSFAGDDETSGLPRPGEKTPVYSPVGLARRFGTLLDRNLQINEFGCSRMSTDGKHYDNLLPLQEHIIYEDEVVQVGAVFIQHSIQSAGYIVKEKPIRHLNAGLLLEKYKLPPGALYGKLLRHKTIQYEGQTIDLNEVSVETTGRTIAILGDTCNPNNIAPYIMDCDVLVHEATGVQSDRPMILQTFHSTGAMAGEFAKRVRAKHLLLNHFSPRSVINNVPCDENTYQRQILREAKEAAGQDVLVTAAYDHLAIPIPKRFAKGSIDNILNKL